jgi:hypothetical protein
VAEEPVECQSAWKVTVHAQALAMVKEGVIAWAKSGDPDTGQWDADPEIRSTGW